ncbi:sulfatase [Weeksellaceae bacterium TAE3-ERU29]|nr:sulfatase [Weeksellaceae bacterium TAE3-ERU29]
MKLRYLSAAIATTIFSSCNTFDKAQKVKYHQKKSDKPNIIVFLVDDMGWQDTSLPFWEKITKLNKKYHTPNMERLAQEGMMFTNAYACAVSTPSRVSLLSGMNAARHKVTNWTMFKDTNPTENDSSLEEPNWNLNGMIMDSQYQNSVYVPQPLPKVLHDNGYKTIHVGKAHFGAYGTSGANPRNLGFDVNVAGHAAGQPASYYGEDNYADQRKDKYVSNVPDLQPYYQSDTFLTEALTLEAKKEIEKSVKENKPFFLNFAHYAVHTPIMPDKRFLDKYKAAGLEDVEAAYATLLEGMDKSLGDIMDYLEENNLDKNTIILFMSDNGGLTAHTRAGGIGTHNLPLRAGKGAIYEGGIREPMIVKWPGVTKPNTKTDENVIIEDFYSTILEMANAVPKGQQSQTIDGVSFVPVLKGKKAENPNRPLVWNYPNNWGISGDGINFYTALREGDYKFIYFYDDRPAELYNIKADIQEQNNIIKQNPAKAKEMAKHLSDILRERKAQIPTSKKDGKPVPLPDEKVNIYL